MTAPLNYSHLPLKTLAAPLALGVLLSAPLAKASDDPPMMASMHAMDHGPMDHGGNHGAGMDAMNMGPPPPASLNWTTVAGAGQFMLGYTPTFMGMSGNYIGTSKLSDSEIATTIPSGQSHSMTMMGKTTTMPTMLRIVPDSMDVQMHMFNAMYGVTENLTIMAMTSYVVKSMSMTTFKGMMGSTVLGTSSGTTDGLGDSMVGVNYRVYHDAINSVVAGLNLTLPTGSATRQITMLSPMGSYMLMRAPYGMQTGSGSVSLVPSLAYSGHLGRWSWGLAYRGFYPMDYNSEGYRWGALSEFHGWGGYTLFPNITTTLHVVGSTQDHISGKDAQIYGLSQNANPLYYGGQKVRLLGGVEIGGGMWGYAKSSISVEAGGPIYQSLNGPQLGESWQVTVSGRVMF
ncbi:hypothetical protein QM467_19210 [Rhodoblastus sp. 17X3]|uniref:hypothetical protein n=1 Tax=Rhodoblastus sp. 17X3 TaxID=3047026 RepID=UPI0024B86969|nr:hypothetical protein [Rhodoblastus sp. 17X3]MDI9850169.1 hypothetical protein [Rhodoblastus sp. 17X3]